MSETAIRDVGFIGRLVPELEAQGFAVYLNPSPSILPPFMREYRPDAVAIKPEKKIAFEVVRSTRLPTRKLQDLQSLFSNQTDWELRVIYDSPLPAWGDLEIASDDAIQAAIQRVMGLKKDGHFVPALVMAWATLEAIGRALLPSPLGRPQTPGRLVEVLAEQGYLTPKEADFLRPVISLRNAAVHGGLDPAINGAQLDQLISILRTLAEFLPGDRKLPPA